MTRRRYQP